MTIKSGRLLVWATLSLILVLGTLCSCKSLPYRITETPTLEEDLMHLEKEQIVSAQVVLRAASGKAIDSETIITTENIQDFAPSSETVARASEAFAAAGFDVGEMVGISFSIAAPVNTFEQVFKTRLRRDERGGVEVIQDDGSGSYELPLDALAESLADFVVVVTFTPPPDFGPTEFLGP